MRKMSKWGTVGTMRGEGPELFGRPLPARRIWAGATRSIQVAPAPETAFARNLSQAKHPASPCRACRANPGQARSARSERDRILFGGTGGRDDGPAGRLLRLFAGRRRGGLGRGRRGGRGLRSLFRGGGRGLGLGLGGRRRGGGRGGRLGFVVRAGHGRKAQAKGQRENGCFHMSLLFHPRDEV